MTTRFTVTVQYHYDVSDRDLVRDYGTLDLEEAAEIDRRNLADHGMLQEDISNYALEKTVTVRAERLN